jgi:4'-phosphopantetheinyl transferase
VTRQRKEPYLAEEHDLNRDARNKPQQKMIIAKEAVTLIHTDTTIRGLPETGLYETLSDDEKSRAESVQLPGERQHSVVRRGIL